LAAAGEPDSNLARLALQTTDGKYDVDYIRRTYRPAAIRATREALERERRHPLNAAEPTLNGSLTAKVKAHLHTIGAAVRPDFTSDQATAWVDALTIKLSDLPASVATKATGRALHIAFEFPSEVEAKVRELATEHLERLARAAADLERIERMIAEASNPHRLPPRPPIPEGEKVVPDELVHKLQRGNPDSPNDGLGQMVVRLGLTLGHITPDQLLKEDEDQ
jgi:hypothetical protein